MTLFHFPFHNVKKSRSIKKRLNRLAIGRFLITMVAMWSVVAGSIMPALLYPVPVQAQAAVGTVPALLARPGLDPKLIAPGTGGELLVQDPLNLSAIFSTNASNQAWAVALNALKHTVFLAAKQGFDDLLNTIAYDSATWLASGGQGQQPMFYTQGWGAYLTSLADGAAGGFIQQVGQNFAGLNVCNPSDLSVKLSIGLGLAQMERPKKPLCSITQLVNNWSQLANDPNFMNRFVGSFDPTKNDVGISVKVFSQYLSAKASAVDAGSKDRTEGGGFKSVVSDISKFIKTPSILVNEQGKRLTVAAFEAKSQGQKVQFGDIVLDAVSTFTETLAGKLFQRLFTEGLAALHGDGSAGTPNSKGKVDLSFLADLFARTNSDLYTGDTGVQALEGAQAARVRFLDLLSADGSKVQPYDLLTALATCPDANNPGPENCAITTSWRQAIDKELTLQTAIEQGFIDRGAPFGSKTYSKDSIYKGISYRSILILRAHSIVPIGWELAADAIDKYYSGKPGGFTLGAVMDEFNNKNSVFYGLIDPNWVLKVPEHLCRAQGFGEQLLYDNLTGGVDANGNGSFTDAGDTPPQRQVGRAEYCADYQSCIRKNPDGTCENYGYCVEEQRTWNLLGQSCPATFNTCQAFQAPDGTQASYLKNTLNYGNCSADNAGCQWYCQEYNPLNNVFTCAPQDERVLHACAQAGGCPVSLSCDVAAGETTCTTSNPTGNTGNVDLTINQACGSGSQSWDGTKCVVNASCTIAQGAVSCSNNSCDALSNLLPTGGFETVIANTPLPKGWNAVSADATQYFQIATAGGQDQVFSGQRSLRFFSYGSSLPGGSQSVASDGIALSTTTEYTISAKVYNRLSSGSTIKMSVVNVLGTVDQRQISGGTGWQDVTFDFKTTTTTNKIVLEVDGAQVAGSAWFDQVRLTAACITNPVTLTLVGTVDQDQSKIHFDRDVKTCAAGDVGCTQLISLKPDAGTNVGANIVPNGSFEVWSSDAAQRGWIGNSISQATMPVDPVTGASDAPKGVAALQIAGGDQTATTQTLALQPNTSYFISFSVKADTATPDALRADLDYIVSGASHTMNLSLNGDETFDAPADWQPYTIDITTPDSSSNFSLVLNNVSANSIYVDAVEIASHGAKAFPPSYSEYGSSGFVHLQKPPASLGCTGNSTTDPTICSAYAPVCEQEEVGCQAYTPVAGGAAVPGVVAYNDYCPVECVGYDSYKQSTTFFETQQPLEYFIPSTARQCTAAEVGCDEFTNLDAVAAGGEGKEYYSEVRLCAKPTDAGVSCQNFYTWQGSDETGFQLKVYSLSAANNAPVEANDNDANWPAAWGKRSSCDGLNSSGVADGGAEDLAANPFCKQFYAADGSIHYEIYDNTITCSGDCHPYRKTRLGESDAIAQTNCEQSHGTWDATINQCIYQVVPNEGVSCSPAAAGCREYRGNTGGNVFAAYQNNFESGTASGWRYGSISSEALSVGGHSLVSDSSAGVSTTFGTLRKNGNAVACSSDPSNLPACADGNSTNCYNSVLNVCQAADDVSGDTCLVNLGQMYCGVMNNVLQSGKTYTVSFWAKSATTAVINGVDVAFTSEAAPLEDFGTVNLTSEWHQYTLGPLTYTQQDPSVRFRVMDPAGNSTNFYVDNIQINQVQDYVYAVKNSWQTPASCDTNPFVSPAQASPQYMLGCEQYRDGDGAPQYLKSFNHLCRTEAVGCQAFIDTKNSSSPFSQVFNETDPLSDVKVPADSLIYLVDQPQFRCDSAVKGCEAVGLPKLNADGNLVSYQTSYLVNDPDQYATTLCTNSEVGCQEYKTPDGSAYFKDPGAKTCEYKVIPGQDTRYGWFKVGSTSATPDCPVVQPPVGEVHPNGSSTSTPGFAGLCPAQYSSCTAFIDPVSTPSKNLIANFDFSQDINQDTKPDSWLIPTTNDSMSQSFDLQADTVYTLGFDSVNYKNTTDTFQLTCPNVSSYDNSLEQIDGLHWKIPAVYGTNDTRDLADNAGNTILERAYSARFMITRNARCTLQIVGDPGTIKDQVKTVELKKTEMSYVLQNTVDKLSCNGVIDPDHGCVAFNDRSLVNYKLGENDVTSLIFDADVSGPWINNGLGILSCAGNCDTNVVLKVKPDRECGEWLSFTSQAKVTDSNGVQKSYGLDLGLCNSLDEGGNCNNFITTSLNKKDYVTQVQDISNTSGYARPGIYFSAATTDQFLHGYKPYDAMQQHGGAALIANGDFERVVGATTEPVGWSPNNKVDAEGWRDYKFQVVSDGHKTVQGGSFLRVNGPYEAFSEDIDVEPDVSQSYILGVWINTENLRDTSATVLPTARVCYYQSDGTTTNNTPTCPPAFLIKAGVGWQYKTFEINASDLDANTQTLKIRLDNTDGPVGDGVCKDSPAQNTSCGLGGYTLFDDVSLNPVLITSDPKADSQDFASRSCRIYPAADALSCRYDKAGTTYYGQYGYCLTADPANPSQCLQWWPVDQIKGEVLEHTNPYTDRAPLYYCIQRKKINVPVAQSGTITATDSKLPEQFQSIPNQGGGEIHFVQFQVNPDYAPMFRYPYIQKLTFHGFAVSYADNNQVYVGVPFTVNMYKNGFEFFPITDTLPFLSFKTDTLGGIIPFDEQKDSWGGFGAVAAPLVNINIAGVKVNVVLALPMSWSTVRAVSDLSSAVTGIAAKLPEPYKSALNVFGNSVGVKVITDQDPEFDNVFTDPTPDVSGDILGFAWYFKQNGTEAAGFSGRFDGNIEVEYCSKLVQVVTSSGANKSWANRVNPGSGYVQNETIPGYCSDNSNYCTATDLSQCGDPSTATCDRTKPPYVYERPFDYDTFLADYDAKPRIPYYSSDYRPFGSIVQPDASQYPNVWDSRSSTYKQPLFYEPPRTSFDKPYQPRMGELHNPEDLKKLFLKTYSIWDWEDNTTPNNDQNSRADDHYYELDNATQGWDVISIWTKSNEYCDASQLDTNGDRLNTDIVCRIKPAINNVAINDATNTAAVIIKNGTVKLSFAPKVDADQLPIRSYTVDWGDGDATLVSGAALLDRPNPDNPFVLYHAYDYWKTRQALGAGKCDDTAGAEQCNTKINITVKDNWNAVGTAVSSGIQIRLQQ